MQYIQLLYMKILIITIVIGVRLGYVLELFIFYYSFVSQFTVGIAGGQQ
jgi:hypothetical protein